MRRVRNWDNRVVQFAIEQRGQPFVWGQTDCVSLYRRILVVMYGEPIGPEWTYDSLKSALVVQQWCGGIRQALVGLGATAIPLSTANTGDVLIDVLRDGYPFAAVLPVVTDKVLLTDPDGVATLIPLSAVPHEVTAYRLPYVW